MSAFYTNPNEVMSASELQLKFEIIGHVDGNVEDIKVVKLKSGNDTTVALPVSRE